MIAWAASGLGLGLAVIYLVRFANDPPSVARSAVKAGSVLSLSSTAIAAGAPPLLAYALILSAIGDFALSRAGPLWFLAGVCAFGAAHILFGFVFEPDILGRLFSVDVNREPLFLLLPVAGLVVAYLVEGVSRGGRALIGLYAVLLLIMWWAGRRTGSLLIQAGASLFVLSDLLIGIAMTDVAKRERRWLPHAVWATYWPAQALILAGVLSLP